MNVYPFIEAERAERRNVNRACALLEVSRAAFYQWARHVVCRRKLTDQDIGERVERIHTESRGTYGAPRVHAALRRDGIATSALPRGRIGWARVPLAW